MNRLAPLAALTLCLAAAVAPAAGEDLDIDAPPHRYAQRTPADRFTRMMERLESGAIPLDRSGEKAFLVSLLAALDIPVTSQMLVFSTTSLQLSFISPSNPRALYFNEDLYVGYIPGGRIELVALDPELGGIFYIFDVPRGDRPLRIERSGRCMNCHAGEDTGHVPGLVIKSVIPGPGGGSLTAFRTGRTGHDIPLSDRFGGWHVTGLPDSVPHHGNLTGRFVAGEIVTLTNAPGARFRFDKYPVATSDVLPQLLHEHQAGFVNRTVEASYRARRAWQEGDGKWPAARKAEMDEQAQRVVRYLLFAEEAALPAGGVPGDPAYQTDFRRGRRPGPGGKSLKDFDLRTRLFQHRCSYMIYSPVFSGLPAPFKELVYRRLGAALVVEGADPDGAHLPAAEKTVIRGILKATLPDLPAGW